MHTVEEPLDPTQIRLLAALGQHRTFVAVAHQFGVHQSTVTRQVDRLEDRLSIKVVQRTSEGYSLTTHGTYLAEQAADFELSYLSFMGTVERLKAETDESVSICVPDGLGTYWIMPQFVRDQRDFGLNVNFLILPDLPALEDLGEGLSIQYQAASNDDFVQITLGHLNVIPYASKAYLDAHGAPQSVEDLLSCPLIARDGPNGLHDLWFDVGEADLQAQLKSSIALTTNSSGSHYAAIRDGLGIGTLPTYADHLDKSLVPVDVGITQRVPIYLVYSQQTRSHPQYSRLHEWLKSCFNTKMYPFFA